MNCDHLWFLAREGHLLHTAYKAFVNHSKFSDLLKKCPDSSYFLCSRRSVIFPLLKSESDILLLLDKNFKGTLRYFFEKKINIQSLASVEEILGSTILEQNISLPEDLTHVFSYLKKIFPELCREAQLERELLIKYCKNQGFSSDKKIGIVDIGYSGTIQHALMGLLGADLQGYYFITLKASKDFNPETVFKAYFCEFLDPSDFNQNPLFKYSLLLEAIMTSPKGQLIRFSSDPSGNVYPIYKEPGKSQINFNQINLIHKGIIRFIEEMLDQFGTYALDIEFPKKTLNILYENAINGKFDLGSLMDILSVEDEYTGMGEINVLEFYGNKLKK